MCYEGGRRIGIAVCVYNLERWLEAKAEEFQACLGHTERHYLQKQNKRQIVGEFWKSISRLS